MHLLKLPHTSKPSFCFITPTAYLEEFATASNTHLVLAHLVHTDETYAQFYKKRSELGDFIMMDNSAYELKEPYAPSQLVQLAKQCGAHVVVLPDYPFQPCQKTIDAAIKFIPIFKENGLGTFFVPQSQAGDLEDWIAGYRWAAENPDIDIIGMSILGIPNALSNIEPAYARVVITQLLQDRGMFAFDKIHHYLGLNAGVALEIPSLIRMKALTTVDSSNPVWMGILGHMYTTNADSYLAVKKINTPVDFSIKMTKDNTTLERIRVNVKLTQRLFQPSMEQKLAWYAQE
jgi:hypothetical protein